MGKPICETVEFPRGELNLWDRSREGLAQYRSLLSEGKDKLECIVRTAARVVS